MKERTDRTRQNLAEREGRIQGNLNARQKRLEESLIRDLSSLTPEQPQPTLRREEPRGGIPASRGYAEHNLQPGTGGQSTGGGIASPLIEGGQGATAPSRYRTYHPAQTVRSTDGLFVWEIEPVASLTFHDANGAEVVVHIAAPGTAAP